MASASRHHPLHLQLIPLYALDLVLTFPPRSSYFLSLSTLFAFSLDIYVFFLCLLASSAIPWSYDVPYQACGWCMLAPDALLPLGSPLPGPSSLTVSTPPSQCSTRNLPQVLNYFFLSEIYIAVCLALTTFLCIHLVTCRSH